MKCPNCKEIIDKESVALAPMDTEETFVEIDVQCRKCGKDFLGRLTQRQLKPSLT